MPSEKVLEAKKAQVAETVEGCSDRRACRLPWFER
jgi:hypothetical protein